MKTHKKHHKDCSETIIEKLPIDCVKNVAVDYMHVVLEGVTKQLLIQWILIRKKTIV